MGASITFTQLRERLAGEPHRRPLLIDVRRPDAFSASGDYIAGALRREPQQVDRWCAQLPSAAAVVIYCVHGHEVSQGVASALRGCGIEASYLEHGIEGWRASGGAMATKPIGAATCWVTRERPKIDRIACPWLIRRFIDQDARFLYVPASDVSNVATRERGQPYDIPGVEFGHVDQACSFDAFVVRFHLGAYPGIEQLATIVRGADTGRLELALESPGLLAISAGLSLVHADDYEMLEHGMVLYDALYRRCQAAHQAPSTSQSRG